MNGLTSEQKLFLQKHDIHLKYVFDAAGLSQKEYRVIMKDLNKLIAFNVPACKNSGHTLRTRSGHCCQCNTARIEFQRRNDSSGVVYIAGSIDGQLIKIGFTKSVDVRSESLNRTKYAGYNDWQILYAIRSESAGRIETKSNSLLHQFNLMKDYKHDGNWQDSYETYRCAYSIARKYVEKACESGGYVAKVERCRQTHSYEFIKH